MVIVFPKDGDASKVQSAGKEDLILLAHPEEDPQEGRISWPGEYDFGGVAVRGLGHGEGKDVSYVVETEGVRCAFLVSPLREFTDNELELLGDIDVLFLPADDTKIAQKMIDQIDPRALIPLPTKDEATFKEILDNCGAKDKGAESEFKVKGKSSLPAEGRDVVILKPTK